MDSFFFKIILICVIIGISVISKAMKKKDDDSPADAFKASPSPKAPVQRDRRPAPPRRPMMPAAPAPGKWSQHAQAAPTPASKAPIQSYTPVRAPQPMRLPDEGARVTAKSPMAQKAAPHGTQSLSGKQFKNKDELRRAIILGEVLAPKF